LLSDCDKRDAARVEDFDHLGEIRERAGQAVDLIDHHDIDESPPDIFQKALQGGTLHRAAREASVIVGGLDEPPSLARLAPDECLTSLTLRVQRVEALFKALLGGFAGVDCRVRDLACSIAALLLRSLEAEEQRPRPSSPGNLARDF
jgi:hypothetical protein